MNSAVSYLRVSSLGQCAEGKDGFQRQREAIKRYAEANGITIIKEFAEEGVSGKSEIEKRPAFQEMVAALLGNGCRTILVEALNRLARQYDVQQQLVTYLASKGITLISADTGEDITAALMGDPMRRALVQMQGIFSELEKNMLVAKLRAARVRAKAKNGKCEGRKNFGDKSGEAGTLSLIRTLHKNGDSAESIANYLNAKGTLSRTGKEWRGSVIRKILARTP